MGWESIGRQDIAYKMQKAYLVLYKLIFSYIFINFLNFYIVIY